MRRQAYRQAIERGLHFLAAEQRLNGGFNSLSSTDRLDFTDSSESPTVFTTALIGQSLQVIPSAELIRKGIASWLLRHKNENDSWNYWRRGSHERQMQAYPDDLDDTACAWSAVIGSMAERFDARAQAGLGRLLVATEQHPGGPYRTWLVGSDHAGKWQDIDVAVNANIIHLLNGLGVDLPGTRSFLEDALIRDVRLRSPYYPSEAVLLYLCARADSGLAQAAASRTEREGLVHKSTAMLDTIVLVNVLLRAGVYGGLLNKELDLIIALQQGDGSWPAQGFYIESDLGQRLYGGSAALTTALVLETLELADLRRTERKVPPIPKVPSRQPAFGMLRKAAERLEQAELGTALQQALEGLEARDGDRQIGSIARHLQVDMAVRLPATTVRCLDQGSIYGWVAYTLYDDILDDEPSASRWLSVANVAARSSVASFRTALPESTLFQAFVERCLTTVDAANDWEQRHARADVTGADKIIITSLPDYGDLHQLADRSWGHVLSTVGILVSTGYGLKSRAVQNWLDFFRHFIIARQLHDDAHDWPEDLRAGRLTAVVCLLLESERLPYHFDSGADLALLKRRFWQDTAEKIADLIENHLTAADRALDACTFLVDGSRYQTYLSRLRDGVRDMRAQRLAAETFIAAFHEPSSERPDLYKYVQGRYTDSYGNGERT